MDPRVEPGVTIRDTRQKKSPAFRRDLPCSHLVVSELTSALALLARVLALTVGILLLLSGLLAATLLLAGLLTRVLVLLARILFLAGHSGSPFVDPSPR
jgi:hypothetical protein